MANLLSIAELSWRQVFPDPTAQTQTKKAEFIATAKLEYAWNMWRISKEQKRTEGEWEIPSALLRRGTITVVNDSASLAELKIFRSFDGDTWIGRLGDNDCKYIRQSLNESKMLSDEDDWGNSLPYIVIGMNIEFPIGARRLTIPIVYATNGEDLEDNIEVDDAIGGLIRNRLVEIYSAKQPVDKTTNNNPNT